MVNVDNEPKDVGDVGFTAVIPAGGSGSRLWPLSTPDHPKFVLDLLGTGTTLLQDTVARVAGIAERTVVVTGQRHADIVATQLPDFDESDLLIEPSPGGSMAAIALAAAVLESRHGPHVIGTFAADHVIAPLAEFHRAVRTAIAAARAGSVVTIGISPRSPATGFGYVRSGEPLDISGAQSATAFTEKPDAATAERFIATGEYSWNAGMFVARTDVLLGHVERLHPEVLTPIREIADAWDTDARAEVCSRLWETVPVITIDHAIAEPVAAEGGVAVVPTSLRWHDIGDFAALAEAIVPDDDGVLRVGRAGEVVAVDAARPMVVGGDKKVAIVGLDDVTVVDTPDALLVLGRDAAQRVREVG